MESQVPSKQGPRQGSGYSIRAVERVCDLLDLVQRAPGGVGLADVVAATGLPKSSAFRYLATLEDRRYVERDPVDGHYRAGSGFLPLQTRGLDVLVERARPLLEAVRDRFGETVNLAVLDGNRTSYAEIVESPRSMRLAARKGDRDPLHCTAVGKAIATMLPAERLRAILEAEGMPARTETTITDIDTYLGEIELTRDRGYAIDDRENEPDGRCVAVPLGDPHVLAAVSLSAPAARFPVEEVATVAEALGEVARDLMATLAAPR
jgi:IclR family transcriptional regulator, acetate operon repressor